MSLQSLRCHTVRQVTEIWTPGAAESQKRKPLTTSRFSKDFDKLEKQEAAANFHYGPDDDIADYVEYAYEVGHRSDESSVVESEHVADAVDGDGDASECSSDHFVPVLPIPEPLPPLDHIDFSDLPGRLDMSGTIPQRRLAALDLLNQHFEIVRRYNLYRRCSVREQVNLSMDRMWDRGLKFWGTSDIYSRKRNVADAFITRQQRSENLVLSFSL